MNNNRECAKYFKSHKAYRRCFLQLRKKWESFGRIAGKIILKNASEEEKYELCGLLGKTFAGDEICFSFTQFDAALQKTRFAPVDMRELLESYFEQKLPTNQERKEAEKQKESIFLAELFQYFVQESGKESAAVLWLKRMTEERKYGYQVLLREYRRDAGKAAELAKHTGHALDYLHTGEDKDYPLAVLAAEITGYPHYFDRGHTAGQLLVHGICALNGKEVPKSAHDWRDLLLQAGVIPDTISSFVHVYGLHLLTQDGFHPAYEAYCARKEPGVITLENLHEASGAQGENGKVYIVENEMVFGFLLEKFRNKEVTLLCTSGQLRSAALLLISLLVKSGNQLYYSGDIDPEGIDIADRLWQRYGNVMKIWRMSPEDYEKSLSDEGISEIRLAKLDHIRNPKLYETACHLREKRRSAYQENLIEMLLEDMNDS